MEKLLGFAHMQLNYWHRVVVCYKQEFAIMLWVRIQLQPNNIFFISMFNLRIAHGTKVGLKEFQAQPVFIC